MLFGFFLMLLMRWQIAHPGAPVPIIGALLEKVLGQPAAGGAFSPDLYNSFGAMHGTIMVFLGIVPLGVRGVRQLRRAADDWRAGHDVFPRVNMASYQAYFIGGLIMCVSFFIPGGAAQAGWTSYSPLATAIPTHGQTFLDYRDGFSHHFIAARRGEFHCHHHPASRPRA